MALLELGLIVLVFGAMALVVGVQERVEERRILARAEAVLMREAGAETLLLDEDDAEPHLVAVGDAA